jgi:hypothetical protein
LSICGRFSEETILSVLSVEARTDREAGEADRSRMVAVGCVKQSARPSFSFPHPLEFHERDAIGNSNEVGPTGLDGSEDGNSNRTGSAFVHALIDD